ncbi:uncharacterized protein LOC105443234 [Strongylocentrotus purpuratus]|uniref:Ig-like domain-containing protein n=1 Tax=Strongylocentrotus purpuratus TaxID=7668 RepID=A0A7M7NDJ9_STRPU|nr:uncharacterized protein LOC105443234 [Strongylocentrotus purpuratus]
MDSLARKISAGLLSSAVSSGLVAGVACDVPEDVVYTDVHKAVRIGDSVVLKCQFRGTPSAVYWKKGDDPMHAPTLVSWITGDPVTGSCEGEKLCQIMEMNAEFSLIIKEVSIVEQGRYVCRVANYKGIPIHNFTDISVFSPPKDPYPIINECQMISPNYTKTPCIISTSQSVEISCSASGYFPDIDLYFLHGSTRLYTKDTIEVTNLDGTKNKTISTIATANEISYVCFASIPGSQEQRTTTVLVNLRTSSSPMPAGSIIPIDKTDGSVAKVVVPVIFIILLAVICISTVLWRRRKQQRRQGIYMDATVVYQPSSLGKIDGIYMDATVVDQPSSLGKIDGIYMDATVVDQPSSLGKIDGIYMDATVVDQPSSLGKIDGIYMDATVVDQPSSLGKIDGIISYFELEKLVEKFDNGSLSLIVAELIEDSKGELESESTKADLYKYLCKWKESSSGSATLLYSAMEKNNLENEDFLASIDNAVSDDDLEHICWHVHSCGKTVQPIVDSLQYSDTNSTKLADNSHISAPSRCEEIWDDLKIMKRWKAMSAAKSYRDEDELQKARKIGFKSKHTELMPSNQMIQLCRALEKAGRTTGDSDGQVYHQLSKTFYKIRGEYKSELTDEVLKEFALNITKPHCQILGNTFRLSADATAARNEEDLEMFRTDIMLKEWVLDQKCSNYEIRRRLRQAAEQCNRPYISDNFIRKEQSEVMTSTTKLPACLTVTNKNQSPGASTSERVQSIQ